MSQWWSAHTHSHYSALDGTTPVKDLVAKAKMLDYPALGLTDHGNMAGATKLYKACKQEGILPYPGVEAYLVDPAAQVDLESKEASKLGRYHLGLLARTERGYQGLVKLVSMSHTRPRFNRFPRLTLDDLIEYAQHYGGDTILMTGCFFGWLQQTLVYREEEQARGVLETYAQHFPHTFVEVQNHGIEGHDGGAWSDEDLVEALVWMAEDFGLPLMATQDSHYLNQNQCNAHGLMKRMVYGGADDEFPGDSFHLASDEWVEDHYTAAQWQEMLVGADHMLSLNQVKISPLDKYEIRMPRIELLDDLPAFESLEKFCREQMGNEDARYHERLDYELDIIKQLDMADYFLHVADYVEWCKAEGICVEARGSANGSYVCFLLGITQVDPIKWGLLFDRFLSVDRTKPPDIDMDIEDGRRADLLDYLDVQYSTTRIGTWCLGPESRILCADLVWRTVKELKAGDRVVGFDEKINGYKTGQQASYRTAEVVENAKVALPSMRVVTDRGEVVSSDAHLWVVKNRYLGGHSKISVWKRTDELVPGDEIVYLCDPWDTDTSYMAGWLSGFLDGEGSFDAQHVRRVAATQVDGDVFDRYIVEMERRGFELYIREKSHGPSGHQGSKPCYLATVSGGIVENMRALGTLRPTRLLKRAGEFWDGLRIYSRLSGKRAIVQSATPIGEQEVYAIGTTTKTLIAEGMLSHNSMLGSNDMGQGSIIRTYQTYRARTACNDEERKRAYARYQSLSDVQRYHPDDHKGLIQLHQMNSVYRSYGVHAAGVLLSGEEFNVQEWIPTMLVASSNTTVTQYDMDDVDEWGLLKDDVLGQATLTVMRRCQEHIGRPDATDFTWIPDDDRAACKLLREGRTDTGIFHFEGWTKSKGGKEIGIAYTKDAIMAQALYMPGAMDTGQKDLYIERRRDKAKRDAVTYLHKAFEKALRPTYGTVIFQEQVLQIMRGLGMGIPAINTFFKVVKDSGRGATQRNQERIAEVRAEFDQHCAENGITDTQAAWDMTAGFVAYGFNKAHATGYGLRAYRCAYLKAHYPLEFMAALLEVWSGRDKEAAYVKEARLMKLRRLPAHVNHSGVAWGIDRKRNALRKGLLSIQGVGEKAAEDIIANQPYSSVEDLVTRCAGRTITGGKDFLATGAYTGRLAVLRDAGALDELPERG
jgi:DNA polymerase III alpha subunit